MTKDVCAPSKRKARTRISLCLVSTVTTIEAANRMR
jgi:hypothetical protein